MQGKAMVMVYSTFPDMESAERIGGELIARKLAACVNILPGMTSLYSWQGRLERGQEVVMLAKTTSAGGERLMGALRARHPYETPAIIALAVGAADTDYLAWLEGAVVSV